MADQVKVSTVAAQLSAACFGCLEGGFGAGRDSGGFLLGHGCQDMDCEAIGLEEIDRDEIDVGFHQV